MFGGCFFDGTYRFPGFTDERSIALSGDQSEYQPEDNSSDLSGDPASSLCTSPEITKVCLKYFFVCLL